MRKIIFDFKDIDQSKLIRESDDRKVKKSNTLGMYEYINEAMKSQKWKTGLGIHAVRKEKIKDKSIDEVLKGICDKGLDIKKGGSVLATVSSLGVSSKLKNYQEELKNYRLESEAATNGVIVLVPTILEGNGEQLYVGFPGMDTSAVGNNHKKTCILDQLCCDNNEYGEVPKEFILGYFKEENGERIFEKNASHFIEMTDEEKGSFIKDLSDRLSEQQKRVSEAVIAGDIQKLEQLSIEMYGNKDGVSEENTVIQNAIFYLNREIEENKQKGQNVNDIKKSKHRILLDAYQDVKLSDLSSAKETLREGVEETKENMMENGYEY